MSKNISNPYSELINMMSDIGASKNTPGISFGKIKSIEPLLVETQGVVLDSNFVKLSNKLKPQKFNCKLNGRFDINCNYTPTISNYNMPNKQIGLTATSTPTVTGGDGTVKVTVNTAINNDSHTHGSHNHTASSLTNISGNGVFDGTIEIKDYGVKIGDIVILVCTNDRQEYYIIDKI